MIDKFNGTREELLAECKRRYPIGTVVRCVYNKAKGTVDGYEYTKCTEFEGVYAPDAGSWLYLSDTGWAEVISYPGTKPSKTIKELYKIY